ncbi:MAG: hypothetical protein CMI66_05635 [Pedosphaera sp.]|nr:hypothetical protein [Pedosphaera sp.]
MTFKLNILLGLALSLVVAIADHHEGESLNESSLIPGTWARDQTQVRGGVMTWKKEIIPTEEANTFIETITTTKADGSIHRHWKLKFKVTRANGPTLVFNGFKMDSKNLGTGKWTGWQDANIRYTFQIDDAFWYEFRDVKNKEGLFTYTRVSKAGENHYQTLAAKKLSILQPMIGTFKGSVNLKNAESYGITEGKKNITFICKWNTDKTVMTGQWAYDDESFDVRLIASYNPRERSIRMNYHASTGNQIEAELIGVYNNGFLWDRGGDTPQGQLYEKCLMDYSKDGQLTHRIIGRTLNGVPEGEEPDIILEKVSE